MSLRLLALSISMMSGSSLIIGCDSSKRPPPPPIISSAIMTDAGGGVSSSSSKHATPPDPRFVDAARTARLAAEKMALTCTIHGGSYEQEEYRRYHDFCSWKAADLESLRAAAGAVRSSAPDAGDGALFAEHVRLFTEWAEEAAKASVTRGTLTHYQDLSLAWNAFQPNESVKVDVGKPSSYIDDVTDLQPSGADAGAHLTWQRCSDGPCVVVNGKKKKR